jgi:protocatechuate 3,4-dioxygenase beta subunit
MDLPGSITGRVVDSSGRPIADARVFVTRGHGRRKNGQFATVTAADGHYRVTHLDPGDYLVRVVTRHQGDHESSVSVLASNAARLDFVL